MAKRYRSRLAQKESKRMMHQSIGLFFLTGICIVALFKWGIPAIIRMSSFMGELQSSNVPIGTEDTLPPYTPQLAIPYEATSSSEIKISGFAEAGTVVKLYNNEEEISAAEVNEDSAFMFESIKLISGENSFYVISQDAANNRSEPSSKETVIFDNQFPVVTISEPRDGARFYGFSEQTISVKGTVSEDSQISVGGRITFADAEGNYTQQVRLESGENEIVVKATDAAGNETRESIKVKFDN